MLGTSYVRINLNSDDERDVTDNKFKHPVDLDTEINNSQYARKEIVVNKITPKRKALRRKV